MLDTIDFILFWPAFSRTCSNFLGPGREGSGWNLLAHIIIGVGADNTRFILFGHGELVGYRLNKGNALEKKYLVY